VPISATVPFFGRKLSRISRVVLNKYITVT
jgi:hypothetical protein